MGRGICSAKRAPEEREALTTGGGPGEGKWRRVPIITFFGEWGHGVTQVAGDCGGDIRGGGDDFNKIAEAKRHQKGRSDRDKDFWAYSFSSNRSTRGQSLIGEKEGLEKTAGRKEGEATRLTELVGRDERG